MGESITDFSLVKGSITKVGSTMNYLLGVITD
jgi:hypothetical protein